MNTQPRKMGRREQIFLGLVLALVAWFAFTALIWKQGAGREIRERVEEYVSNDGARDGRVGDSDLTNLTISGAITLSGGGLIDNATVWCVTGTPLYGDITANGNIIGDNSTVITNMAIGAIQ